MNDGRKTAWMYLRGEGTSGAEITAAQDVLLLADAFDLQAKQ